MYEVKSVWAKNGSHWLTLSRNTTTLYVVSFMHFESWRLVYGVAGEDGTDLQESQVHYSLASPLRAHPDWIESMAGSVFDAALLTPIIRDAVDQAQREAKHPSSVEGRRFPCAHLAPDLLVEALDE